MAMIIHPTPRSINGDCPFHTEKTPWRTAISQGVDVHSLAVLSRIGRAFALDFGHQRVQAGQISRSFWLSPSFARMA